MTPTHQRYVPRPVGVGCLSILYWIAAVAVTLGLLTPAAVGLLKRHSQAAAANPSPPIQIPPEAWVAIVGSICVLFLLYAFAYGIWKGAKWTWCVLMFIFFGGLLNNVSVICLALFTEKSNAPESAAVMAIAGVQAIISGLWTLYFLKNSVMDFFGLQLSAGRYALIYFLIWFVPTASCTFYFMSLTPEQVAAISKTFSEKSVAGTNVVNRAESPLAALLKGLHKTEALAAPKTVSLSKATAAYSPDDHSKLLGTFTEGTRLEILPASGSAEWTSVRFVDPKGVEIRGVCKTSELEANYIPPDPKTDALIPGLPAKDNSDKFPPPHELKLCTREVHVFDVEDPSKQLGSFIAGTQVEIGVRYDQKTGLSYARYKQPNGSYLVGLIYPNDLSGRTTRLKPSADARYNLDPDILPHRLKPANSTSW